MLSDEGRKEVNSLFSNNLTPSEAYHEFFILKKDCRDDYNCHLEKANKFKCPRRTDCNSLYIKYCHKHFGGENGAEMFCNLEEEINNIMGTHKEAKTVYQVYDKDGEAVLILVTITQLMIGVHHKVYVLVGLRFFEYISKSLFLVGTHYKFTVALRLCHICFLY